MGARPTNSLTNAGEVAELIPGGMDVTRQRSGSGGETELSQST